MEALSRVHDEGRQRRRNNRARTCGLRLPKAALFLLSYIPLVAEVGFEPTAFWL